MTRCQKGFQVVVDGQGIGAPLVLIAQAVAIVVRAFLHAEGVKLVAIAVAIPSGNRRTSAIIHCPWAVANPHSSTMPMQSSK